MIEELKPCPFCGREAIHADDIVCCKGGEACPTGFGGEGEDVREIWNTRPLEDVLFARAEAAERRIVKLEIALRKIADQVDRKYGPLPTSGARRLALEALEEEVER